MVRVSQEMVDRVIDRALRGERVSVAELMVLSVLWEAQEPRVADAVRERLCDDPTRVAA